MQDEIFERCPHDKENPYVMINRDLTRNGALSFQARGFLVYLLSNVSHWKINRNHIMETQNIGKDKLKSLIDELILHGYMEMRSERSEKGFFKVKYLISETNKFKKFDTMAENPLPVNPPRETRQHKKDLLKEKTKEEEKEINKEKAPLTPDGGNSSSLSSSRKKVKEDRKERAAHVSTTDSQHEALLAKANRDENLVKLWYERLSDWKLQKQMRGGNDYLSICKWVIAAVAMDGNEKVTISATTKEQISPQLQKNLEYVLSLKREYPEVFSHMKVFGRKYVVNTETKEDLFLDISDLEFKHAFLKLANVRET